MEEYQDHISKVKISNPRHLNKSREKIAQHQILGFLNDHTKVPWVPCLCCSVKWLPGTVLLPRHPEVVIKVRHLASKTTWHPACQLGLMSALEQLK